MMLWNALFLAIAAIRRNGVRSLLTALGVVIGVASVILMVNLGRSATQNVTDEIAKMGPNLLFVRSGMGPRGPTGTRGEAKALTMDDVEAIDREVANITVAPTVSTQATLVVGNINHSASVIGTTNPYFYIRNRSLVRGREFIPDELDRGLPTCVIGTTVAQELFGDSDPLGQRIRVDRLSCLVIGALDEKGEAMGEDQDDVVIMPLLAVQRRLIGTHDVSEILVSAATSTATAQVQADLEELLRARRNIGPETDDDFHVRDMQELASALQNTTSALTALLAAIAAVSLVVGGIGIMNIMLVSVTERTREIGIRIAIGARAREVLLQFLVEATALSVFGGAVGVLVGLIGSYGITLQLGMPWIVSSTAIITAFVVSALIGVAFGLIPARKAAYLDPIDALRHE